MFQNTWIGNVAINIDGVEMLLFDNSVLKMYLLNTQLTLHINSFHLVYLNLLQKTICQKYMIKRLIMP